MTMNQALFTELNMSIDNIISKLKANKQKVYENELNELSRIIKQSSTSSHQGSFFEKADAIKCIMKIINKIDKEIASIEHEMHGVANYSDYENNRVKDIEFKQIVKNDLNTMLNVIVSVRPQNKDKNLADRVKLMK